MTTPLRYVTLPLLLWSASCAACFSPPEAQRVTPQQLLDRASNVALARVASAEVLEHGQARYDFVVEQRFAGTGPERFSIVGPAASWGGNNETYEHHFDPRFWTDGFGRTPNDTDCQVKPDFAVGATYLLFLDEPRTWKSFEMIVRTHGGATVRDKWLQAVERHFNAPTALRGDEAPPAPSVIPEPSPHADAIRLVMQAHVLHIATLDPAPASWHDTRVRTWTAQRRIAPGVLDTTHQFEVRYLIDDEVVGRWVVDTRTNQVSEVVGAATRQADERRATEREPD